MFGSALPWFDALTQCFKLQVDINTECNLSIYILLYGIRYLYQDLYSRYIPVVVH